MLLVTVVFFISSIKPKPQKKNLNVSHFSSEKIDFSFEYPKNYGIAQEELRNKSNSSGLVQSGQAIWISFSNNKNLNIVLASKDYKEFKEIVYTGSSDIVNLCQKTDIDEVGNGCKKRIIGSKEVVEQTEYIVDEGIYNLIHKYLIQISSDKYSGITVMQGFPEIYNELNSDLTDDNSTIPVRKYAETIINKDDANNFNNQINDLEKVIESIVIK
ncbi:hypothetical protein KKG41_04395 [Patescibacteria group bacterium]|nr:hypothetical protein [Patescibacteria group bacterium]